MDAEKQQLLVCAGLLSELGGELERARRYVAWLRERGVRADTFAMRRALCDFTEAKAAFEATETQYLALRAALEDRA